MGAFVFGKKTIYPYVHFHFSHYQTDSDYIKGITMFQSAYNQASNNAYSNYIQQNYNAAQLRALENVFGQYNTIETWESYIAGVIESEISSNLRQSVEHVLNSKNAFVSAMSGVNLTARRSETIDDFLRSIGNILKELGENNTIFTTMRYILLSKGTNQTLSNLRASFCKAIQKQGIGKVDLELTNNILTRFYQLLSSDPNGKLKKGDVKGFVGKKMAEDLELIPPMLLSRAISSSIGNSIGQLRHTGSNRRGSIKIQEVSGDVFTEGPATVEIKPDSVLKIRINTDNQISGSVEIDTGISTKFYNQKALKDFGVGTISSTPFYQYALGTLKKPDTLQMRHILSNTIAFQKENGSEYATLKSAIIKRYITTFLSGTGTTSNEIKDTSQILFVNDKAYPMSLIIKKIAQSEAIQDLDGIFKITYKNPNKWLGDGGPSKARAYKRSKDFLHNLHNIKMSIKFHPEQVFTKLGL